MRKIDSLLSKHPFFKGMGEWYLEQLSRYAEERSMPSGKYLIREGRVADKFYLILKGNVTVGTTARGGIFKPIQTLGPKDIVGWSWLLPPHRCYFDAKTSKPVTLIVLNGKYLRAKCEEDPVLCNQVLRRLAGFLIQRVTALRKAT